MYFIRHAGRMQSTSRRDAGVWHQTRSLLYKNLLIKWRTKQQSLQLQELILPLLLLGLLILISILNPHVYYGGISTMELEREDHFFKGLGYTPITNITNHIMEEVAQEMIEHRLEMFASEEDLENASLYDPSSYVGVVFMDSSATSYRLRFPYNQLPLPSDYTESINCFTGSVNCRAANYWYTGFVRLQSLIDAAIIQMQTKRSVRSEMDLEVVMMGQPGSVEVQKFSHALISIYLVLAFTPFVTFLIVNVVAEKERRLKDTMTMMGLYDTAFLSWGLLYAALVTTMSVLMAVIATYTALFPNSDFLLIFLLIFLYGISSIFFSFMLTPLFKKPKFASTVGSMLTVVFGCLSLFTVLMKDFPQPLVWLLCLLSPSAFSIGIAQVVYLEAQGDGAVFSSLANGPHPLYVPLLMLVLDCILYLLLAVYLDQVLPEFGVRRSLLYFLKPSYWSKRRKRYVEVSSVYDAEGKGGPNGDESIEPVSPEFRGKEAIILNIHKVYKEKDNVVEALRLTFDIYEGQITALLGHSGAGKSTLMNILCGICPPSATIYGSPVAEIADASEMKQLVGICPQFNIIFDVLTVEEHLRIFAAIKGIPPADIDAEVTKVLKDLDLQKIMSAQAKNLSGGQKRKLSVGIAILGDPKQILLLDEPTAGMDPCSRHQVWALLKSRRAGRVTVLSTHYMDEADILARKAVISQGQLKCVGSSLYLKIKCGVGYQLMSISERCEADKVTSLVEHHVPKATLSRQHDAELTFTLPFESMDTFSLFSELDCQPSLGIINYGVTMTTLEDVFLRLEAEAEVDQAYSVFHREQVEVDCDSSSLDDLDQRLLTFSDSKADVVSGHALWRQQFSTVAWLHMLNMRRERKAFIYLALFLVFVAAVLVLSLVTGNIQNNSPDRQLLPVYLLKKNEAPHRYATSLLVQNSSSDISDLIHNLESQDVQVEMMKHSDYMVAAPHSAAINVTGSSKGFRFSVAFNSTMVHSLPMAVNLLSNTLLRGLNGTGRIRTWTKPFDQIPDATSYATSYALVYIEAIILGMLAAGMPAYFAMDHTRDRESQIKCRSTLRISGLLPSAYWCGQAAVDIPFFYLILSSMTAILFSFHTGSLLTSSNLTAVVLCMVGYGPAMILFTYVFSFGFARVQSNRDFFSVISMMVCVMSASLVQFVNDSPGLTRNLHNILCFLNPLYPLMGCLNCITKATFPSSLDEENSLWKNLLIAVVSPYLQSVLLLFLLRWLEIRYGGRTMKDDQFCISSQSKPVAARNPEEGLSEDEDVRMEKARVKEALTCQSCEEKPVVVVSNLRKQHEGRRDAFSLNKTRKVTTKNVSFCVRKEVLGLLGPNGAGKTSVMHMLSGDTAPSAGQVLMGDYSTEFRPVDRPVDHVGYCPQVNPLWPRITLQEHLEIYAAIKGLRGQDVPGIIKVVNALELKEHLNKQTKTLSAGLKRKLCFAMSMIGNPAIVLLDEPSSGMDPKSKQRMRAIRAAFKNRQRGAILTTHYMEEAEAVCDRVAIMVSGQLCIGSIQHLKGKYGQGYSLEVKLREELTGLQQVALLHKEILQIFPHAARQEVATLMVYKIPKQDVQSLARSFSQLESKQTFNFEEFNFSQSTLEQLQVFMEFAKEQENEEEEVGSLSTTFQWQRLRQDGPVSVNNTDSIVHQL
uniref:ATP-binding cassette, sub-family A (ABC1), member 5 n=1 Tax=Labrus bergylta TaxID=56723 RepID=A0A3Q3GZ83_9LABR